MCCVSHLRSKLIDACIKASFVRRVTYVLLYVFHGLP